MSLPRSLAVLIVLLTGAPIQPSVAGAAGQRVAGTPAWVQIFPTGSPPSARAAHSAIYDPVRDRMIVFAGYLVDNDVWALSLSGPPAWTKLTPAGMPNAWRYGHTAIYDPVRDRMLVFGGRSDFLDMNDVWAMSLAGTPAWTQLAPAGPLPSGRSGHVAIYDPVRDRMLIYGGFHGSSSLWDVWVLSLSGTPTWTQLSPLGTAPVSSCCGISAVYDPAQDRMLVYNFDSVWALSLGGTPAWTQLSPGGAPTPPRYGESSVYDAASGRMVMFGGYAAGELNDTWTLSLTGTLAWDAFTPAGPPPPPRDEHSAVFDSARDRMLVFGGFTGTEEGPIDYNDVWALECPCWVLDVPESPRKLMRVGASEPCPTLGPTNVRLEIPAPALVTASIYDVGGRLVRQVEDQALPAGTHSLSWDGRNAASVRVASGVYFWRIAVGGSQFRRTVVVVR